jgi:hypothetical protein
MNRILQILALSCLSVFASASLLRADDDIASAGTRTEFYVGALVPWNSTGGDFDNRLFGNADGTGIASDFDPAVGLGLVLGLKGIRPSGRAFAIEGSLQGSGHDTDTNTDVGFGLLSLDFKFFPTTGGAVDPWIQAGLNFAAIEVENGWTNAGGGAEDLTFSGGGFDVGVGAMRYLSPRFALHLAAIYRFLTYDQADYGRRADLDDEIRADTLSIELGATFRFSRG